MKVSFLNSDVKCLLNMLSCTRAVSIQYMYYVCVTIHLLLYFLSIV